MTKLAFKKITSPIWRPGARQFGKKVYCHYSFTVETVNDSTVILLFTVAALEDLLHALILSYFLPTTTPVQYYLGIFYF